MSLISKIGRKSIKTRLGFGVMYLLLILGGITMVIPFLVMVSNSFKSGVDSQEYDMLPAYWFNGKVLEQKYLEQQCNYNLTVLNGLARATAAIVAEVPLPPAASALQQTDYEEYLRTLPVNFTLLGNQGSSGYNPRMYGTHPAVQDYRTALLKKYGTLAGVETAYQLSYSGGIETLFPPTERWSERPYQPIIDKRMTDFFDFKQQQPLDRIIPVTVQSLWTNELRTKISADVSAVNQQLGAHYASLDDAACPSQAPAAPAFRKAWEEFVRKTVPLWFIRADDTARGAWVAFLRLRFKGDWTLYHRTHPAVAGQDFAQVPLPTNDLLLKDPVMTGEWNDFLMRDAPLTALSLDTPELRYSAFLRGKYHTIAAVNQAYGTSYASFDAVALPTLAVLVRTCQQNAGRIRREFITRNYRTVTSYLLLHGRAGLNTIILVLLSLLFTLTVNPISAYALSRFKLKATNKILLFLLATMAFPGEIAMIPNFLLLKELHLLNTYWALLLPGMASGFSIFLLKGMFDGLPQDLYEAAELDGAGEATIFWKVTMPLVKPFLAYLALGTFIATYSSFMFAFLLCPDPKMWTIMVYLQQMNWASAPIQFAAFVLASLPTLVVFVTCQRIIMHGIVLPTEK